MVTANNIKNKLNGLIQKANQTTGKADTDMTMAIDSLITGFGQGGETWELISEVITTEEVNKIVLSDGTTGYKKLAICGHIYPPTINVDTSARDVSLFTDRTNHYGPLFKFSGGRPKDTVTNGRGFCAIALGGGGMVITIGGGNTVDASTPQATYISYTTKHNFENPMKNMTLQVWGNQYFGVNTVVRLWGVRA